LLIITAGYASAQNVPSHTQVSPAAGGGFDFPAQLTLFAALATYSNGIIANVTQANFSNARALLASYNSTVASLSASAKNPQDAAVVAMTASQGNFGSLITYAQRYNDLYVNETSLNAAALRSNASTANALEMQTLNGTINTLQSTIQGRSADIYSVAVLNGLNLSQYGNSTALFDAYTTQVDSRVANVTASVFLTPSLTLTTNKNNTTYGDVVVLAGSLLDNQTAVTNSSVGVYVDNATIGAMQTNANGSYAYKLPIQTISPGRHVAFVRFAPADAPYNPAQSPPRNFSVAKLPVNNTVNFLSGIALGSNLEANGRLTTKNGPVTNATVSLVVGGTEVAQTQTDQNGIYAFSVPAAQFYLSAVPNGAVANTVFNPSGQPLDPAASAAVQLPADLTAVYGMIVAVTFVVLLGIFLYSRRVGRRVPSAVPEAVTTPAEPSIEGGETPVAFEAPTPPIPAEPVIDWIAARDQARDAFSQGDDELAITTLFDAAVASLSAAAHVRLAAPMTYSEKSWALQAAMPDVSVALRELTTTYELVNYGGRSLTEAQRDAALSAFESLRGHVFSTKEER
jgi:VCBS repeat-containing protein